MENELNSIRVLISDDQPIFRFGLRNLLESQPDITVVGEGRVSPEVIALVRELRPDILLLDLEASDGAGLKILRNLASSPLPIRTLAMTSGGDKASVLEALHLGACGVVLKESSQEVWLESLRSVVAGQYWLGRESFAIVIEALHESTPHQDSPGSVKQHGLSPRELKVIERISAGLSNKEIGHELSICERTVKHRLTNVFQKLGVSNRLELAIFAIEHRLVEKQ